MKTATPPRKQSQDENLEPPSIDLILEKAYRIHRWDPLSRAAFYSSQPGQRARRVVRSGGRSSKTPAE